jgi:DUF971 family protein
VALIPKSVRLRGDGDTLAIEWSDGHRSFYPYQYLRDRCPCATCKDREVPAPPGPNALPMYGKGSLKPAKAELVGRYALQMFWNDGHSAGIYTFDYLRELCPCAECKGARAEAF